MPDYIRRSISVWKKTNKNQRMMAGITGGLFLVGLGLLMLDYCASTKEIQGGLLRNESGNGNRKELLRVEDEGGEAVKVEVDVSERQYSESETEQLFERCIDKLEQKILGENESSDCIRTDMNLVSELAGEEVDISWELDRYDVMNIYGELKEDMLKEEGVMVKLRATITYRAAPEEQAIYESTVMIYPENSVEHMSLESKVTSAVETIDSDTRTEKSLQLPKEVEGQKLRYYYQMDFRGVVVLVMSVVIGILFVALEQQNRDKALQEKKRQMLLDYPEIVSKLTLLLGAGMIVRRAWKKVVDDYEKEKGKMGLRPAYEEMKQTIIEMEGGVSEKESYERFGKRCNVQEYMKLGALLSQNLKKGTKGLSEMMRLEAIQAFEERKARARRLGEEAGTKLLLPMFLMLSVVLIIVIVPAFLSIQL